MMDMVLLQHDTDTIKPEMISKGTLHVHQWLVNLPAMDQQHWQMNEIDYLLHRTDADIKTVVVLFHAVNGQL